MCGAVQKSLPVVHSVAEKGFVELLRLLSELGIDLTTSLDAVSLPIQISHFLYLRWFNTDLLSHCTQLVKVGYLCALSVVSDLFDPLASALFATLLLLLLLLIRMG